MNSKRFLVTAIALTVAALRFLKGRIFQGGSFALYIAWSVNSFTNGFARLTQVIPAQFFIIHARNIDVDINAAQQKAGYPFLIFVKAVSTHP